jgi:hypothetical protein
MPSRLKRLKITRADLVDRGANYDPSSGEGAHVLLFKRADPVPLPPGDGELPDDLVEKRIVRRGHKHVVLSESGKVLGTHDTRAEALAQLRAVEASKRRRGAKKAVLDAMGKVFGWPDEPDEPLEKADEPPPPTFTEALMREKMDEVMEDLSDHVWALRSTLYGILASAATNKAELVSGALDQFKASAGGCVTQWLGDGEVEKAGRKISTERLARLKEMSETLSRLIAEAEAAPQGKREAADASLAKQARLSGAKPQEGEGMPTQEEFDAVMKRLETLEGTAGQATELKKQLDETNAKLASAEEKVAKAEETAQQEKDLRETQETIALAKRLGLNPDDDAAVIKALRSKDPEGWTWVEKQLTALRAQVKAGHLFKTAGRDGTSEPLAGAEDEAFRRADELVAKDAKLSQNDALARVFRDDPALYRRYKSETSVHGRSGAKDDTDGE